MKRNQRLPELRALPRAPGVVVALACSVMGCPQLLVDDFDPPDAAVGGDAGGSGDGGASAGLGGNGGSSGRGGAGGDEVGTGGVTATGGSGPCVLGDFSEPEIVTGLERGGALWGPSLSADGLMLSFSESIDDEQEDIYLSKRARRDAPFGAALPALGVNTQASEGTTFLCSGGLRLYFFSDRPGGNGDRDLYVAARTSLELEFDGVAEVAGVNGSDKDHMPWLAPDELTIYFTSTRAANMGSSNIWTAQRQRTADGFSPPTELSNVNSSVKDDSPSLTADQLTLFFSSERDGGPGNFDIWMATRETASGAFDAPELVPVVNSSLSEQNIALSGDGLELIFSSSRSGEEQLFRSVRSCR